MQSACSQNAVGMQSACSQHAVSSQNAVSVRSEGTHNVQCDGTATAPRVQDRAQMGSFMSGSRAQRRCCKRASCSPIRDGAGGAHLPCAHAHRAGGAAGRERGQAGGRDGRCLSGWVWGGGEVAASLQDDILRGRPALELPGELDADHLRPAENARGRGFGLSAGGERSEKRLSAALGDALIAWPVQSAIITRESRAPEEAAPAAPALARRAVRWPGRYEKRASPASRVARHAIQRHAAAARAAYRERAGRRGRSCRQRRGRRRARPTEGGERRGLLPTNMSIPYTTPITLANYSPLLTISLSLNTIAALNHAYERCEGKCCGGGGGAPWGPSAPTAGLP